MSAIDTPDGTGVLGLAALLTVEEVSDGLFRGPAMGDGRPRIFGGQVIGQAVMAAIRAVPAPREIHSIHATFLRSGGDEQPTFYRVTREYEGRSFAMVRIVASQNDNAILTATASFHVPEQGVSHQAPMPDVPSPDRLVTTVQHFASIGASPPPSSSRLFDPDWPIEVRPVDPVSLRRFDKAPPHQNFWFRVAPLPDDPALHRATLAYMSDFVLMTASLQPHGVPLGVPELQSTSLDHAIWFHEPCRADEWLLHATDSPWAGHARGMNRGLIYTREGRLVATTAQEALIRMRKGK